MTQRRISCLVAVFLATFLVVTPASAGESGSGIDWQSKLRQAVRLAHRTHQPLLITVSASWCGPCRRIHRQTFRDDRVVQEINAHFVPVLLDADKHAGLIERLDVVALPTTLLITLDGKRSQCLARFRNAKELLKGLRTFRARQVAGRARIRS